MVSIPTRGPRKPDQATVEFIEPTLANRKKLAALIVSVIVLGVTVDRWLFPAYFGYIGRLAVCAQLPWLRGSLIAMMMLPIVIAASWAVPQALRLLSYGQSPPPGTWVFVRTRIKRGRTVRWQAYGLLLWSLVAVVFPFWGWHLMASTPIFSPSKKCIHAVLDGNAPRQDARGATR
jgi:hypothetical protein